MNNIEILDKLRKMLFLTQQANECGLSNNDFKEDIQILSGAIELIENLLKERQADKDRINILRDRVQEEEDTIKSLTNIFANEKQEYLNRIKELEDEQKGYKDRIKELKIALEEVEELLEDSIPKSLVKEKIKELGKQEKAELKGMKGQDRYVVKQEYQFKRNVLQELLGE